jgi:signal transduction histidine kinase
MTAERPVGAATSGAAAAQRTLPDRPVTRRARSPRFKLRVWLVLGYLVVFSLPWIAIVGSGALAHDLRAQTRESLIAQGRVWALRIASTMGEGDDIASAGRRLQSDLDVTREQTLCAVQVVDATGRVVATTPGTSDASLGDDPEVAAALAGDVGAVERERDPLSEGADRTGPSRFAPVRLFVAVPVVHEREVVGAVVMSRTPREEVQAFVQMGPRLGIAVLGVVAFTFALALASGHWGSRSLAQLASAARRIAAGSREATELQALEGSRVREVGEVASAVAAMHDQIQARLDYIDEFAGNVAHEFRTPIATLRGTIELMQDDGEMDPAQRDKFLANAHAELARLGALIDGLLALARAERATALRHIDVVALVGGIADARGVAVQGSCADVEGAPQQLEAAIGNLVDNACRHGGPNVAIELGDDADDVTIAVVDDGAGVDPGDRDRLFDRFFTTDRKRGTGLGLAIVRAVARAHGGDVAVESTARRTAFTIRLPRARART